MQVIYDNLCLSCGGPLSNIELSKRPICNKCSESLWTSLYESFKEELTELEALFEKLVNSKPWSIQRMWMKRLLWNESFAIVAPTGVGKTTLLQVYCMYSALKGKKCYFILPTTTLVEQVFKNLSTWRSKIGSTVRIIGYHSGVRNRVDVIERIANKDFDILITTSAFLSRQYKLLDKTKFEVIIVDDVDSVLRNSRNIDKILMLLGFSNETIKKAFRLINKKIELMKAKLLDNKQLLSSIVKEIIEIERDIYSEIKEKNIGQLVISSATGKGKGLRVKLFRELMGFSIGGTSDYLRNIIDTYKVMDDPIRDSVEIVSKLGSGGLIFVSKDINSKDLVQKLIKELNNIGLRALYARSGQKFLDKLHRGEVDVLIGSASYYGVLCRGLDEPLRIKYAVFIGIPKFTLKAEKALNNPKHLVKALMLLRDYGIEVEECEMRIKDLRRYLFKLKPIEWNIIRGALSGRIQVNEIHDKYGEVINKLNEIKSYALSKLNEVLKHKESLRTYSALIMKKNNDIYMLIPDIATYIQASGRTSRLYGGSMTLGFSVLLVDVPELIDIFKKKIRMLIHGFELTSLDKIDIDDVKKQLSLSRRRRKDKQSINVKTALLIVESPTKAKTIAKMFGRPTKRRIGKVVVYEIPAYINNNIYVLSITATRGHLFDLTTKDIGVFGVIIRENEVIPVYSTIKKCLQCKHQFTDNSKTCPKCGSTLISDSIDVIRSIQKLAQEVDEILIATDPDVEGEKIAWDIANIVKPFNNNIKRVEVHEITLTALLKALSRPRSINERLVEAQVIRRIDDRWIGFGLSKILQMTMGMKWLGAGRVQTPVLGWIINRYNEWKQKKAYKMTIHVNGIKITHYIPDRDTAIRIAEHIKTHGLLVSKINYSTEMLSPKPPFTTDELILEASKKLRLTASKVMKLAQDLFEAGLITYHRTDSTYTSNDGILIAREYLNNKDLTNYFISRHWSKPKTHECIRPTKPIDREQLERMILDGSLPLTIPLTMKHLNLYDLIFRRFIASQMSQTEVVKADMTFKTINMSEGHNISLNISLPIEVKKHGFDLVYPLTIISEAKKIKEGDLLLPEEVKVNKTSIIILYDHGSIVLEMKNRGIGRPSTYAKIIEKLLSHGYVIESKKRKFLIPTKLGIKVHEYLSSKYSDLVSELKTRLLENIMRKIEEGEMKYHEALSIIMEDLDRVLNTINNLSSKELELKMSA